MLYSSITDCIELGKKQVEQKYDQILAQKLPKSIRNNRLEQSRKSKEFIEVENLIDELNDYQLNDAVSVLQ
jgi:hypothetical protein